MSEKLPRFPDQIIGYDAHLQLIFEGWAVLRVDHVKKLQDEIERLRAKTPNDGELEVSMREKLARSIMADMGRQNPSLDPVDDGEHLGMADDYDNKFYDGYELADAVLDALIEPTEGMVDLGGHAYNLTGISGASGFPDNSEEHTTFIFEAMIQAAKDGK